jgi:putative colanic acid biosynthesis acetyltransferase WcaF
MSTSSSGNAPGDVTTGATRNYEFKNPHSLKNKLGRLLWRYVWMILFRPTPVRLGGAWRRVLLRLFGAKIGDTWLHPSVRVWAPWMLTSGDHVFVDQNVNLYNAYGIELGDRVIISFDSTLCTASHDHADVRFALTGNPIRIGSDCWIAADVFIAPGVSIGARTVVGARSSVFGDLPEGMICVGSPARPIKPRVLKATL